MKRMIIYIFIMSLLSGCNGMKSQADQETKPIGNAAIVNQTDADKAKKMLLQMEEIIDVKGVAQEKDLYVAVKVKHFDRLRLKKIRENSFHRLEKIFPKKNIHVSTDKKIFMELEKLETKLQKKAIKEKELQKKLKKIDEDMKG